jgi:hypothetical protein
LGKGDGPKRGGNLGGGSAGKISGDFGQIPENSRVFVFWGIFLCFFAHFQ